MSKAYLVCLRLFKAINRGAFLEKPRIKNVTPRRLGLVDNRLDCYGASILDFLRARALFLITLTVKDKVNVAIRLTSPGSAERGRSCLDL